MRRNWKEFLARMQFKISRLPKMKMQMPKIQDSLAKMREIKLDSFARMPELKGSSFARMQEINTNLLLDMQESAERLSRSLFTFKFVMVGFVVLFLAVIITSTGLGGAGMTASGAVANHAESAQSDNRSTERPVAQSQPVEQALSVVQVQPDSIQQTDANVSYVDIARQDANAMGINADLFVRQIQQESGFDPNAVSSAGAIGIAQFMPVTAAQYGIDPHDPVQSLNAAARYMANYNSIYGDYAKALAAYNAGAGAVDSAVSSGGSNWRAYLPAETQNYIAVIMG
jgi:hypothetical protein